MREGPVLKKYSIANPGITPAYAGRTGSILKLRNNLRDHPRLCGKDSNESGMNCFSMGSPPLMREGLNFACFR